MSPAQAAEVAKVSRRTIMRAVKSQALRASRDNRFQTQIEPEDLRRWMDAQGVSHGQKVGAAQVKGHPEAAQAGEARAVELAVLRERLDVAQKALATLDATWRERLEGAEKAGDALRGRAEAAERDRDAWRDQAGVWRARLEAAERQPSGPREERPKGFLRRLLGR